ncbi:EPM2A-interacting protein 1-like [Macrobrachium rosenbergii]|uniref:EPM2A-interacting protein 1-like n=1 Tax=Macrobrachium rosenbergii TaxID=79674 RepID=UPI0034D742FE
MEAIELGYAQYGARTASAQQIAVPKEYNVRRHYTQTMLKYIRNIVEKARDDKVEELEQSLKQQQSLFKNVRHVSDAAVKARTTKSDDIFASLVRALDKLGVDWKKCVSLATDGAPQMVGRKAGVVAKLQEKLMALNPDNQFPFQRQSASHNLAHFPNLKSMQNKNNIDDGDLAEKYCEKISKLRDEFQNRFSDFKCMENEFAVFRNPFSVDVNVLPEPLQLEIIDMQCDSVLKDKFSTCQLSTFYQYVDSKYPNVKYLASKIMSMYGSTFACEQLFSVMNINKSRLRSKLSDEHLNSILKIATKSFTPNFDALVKKKRSQVSGSSSSQH